MSMTRVGSSEQLKYFMLYCQAAHLSHANTWAGGSGCDPEAAACCSTLRALSAAGMAAAAAALGLTEAATGACVFSCWLLLSPA